MATTPQNHQDQKDNDGQLLVVTMRRPQQRWVGPQDHQQRQRRMKRTNTTIDESFKLQQHLATFKP
jgi:hypothetical protein